MPRTARATATTFDPVVVGQRECDAWAAYYRRDWMQFLRAAFGMVRAGFGMNRRRTLLGAWYVLRANQEWAPFPDNDPAAARAQMRRFYSLVAADGLHRFDPGRAADLEVEWWRVHRMHQHAAGRPATADGSVVEGSVVDGSVTAGSVVDGSVVDGSVVDGSVVQDSVTEGSEIDLAAALVELYSYVYQLPQGTVRPAADFRVRAMDVSDQWVAAGCDLADPLLAHERRLLVASYSALRDAIDRGWPTLIKQVARLRIDDRECCLNYRICGGLSFCRPAPMR